MPTMPTEDSGASSPDGPARDDFDVQVSALAALGEPLRRSLYRYVAGQAAPVNRDQAAEALGVPRHTAKFHLDKLVDDGLLEVDYARPPGRSGPGAGRPAKLYRRSSGQIAVSLPERRYDLAARLLAQAITDAARHALPVGDALARAAREAGRSLGEKAARRAGRRPSRSTALAAGAAVLRELGYEPRQDAAGISLANCPFYPLAQDYTDLVCGANLDLISGLVEGFGQPGLQAVLDPAPGRCCVRIR